MQYIMFSMLYTCTCREEEVGAMYCTPLHSQEGPELLFIVLYPEKQYKHEENIYLNRHAL